MFWGLPNNAGHLARVIFGTYFPFNIKFLNKNSAFSWHCSLSKNGFLISSDFGALFGADRPCQHPHYRILAQCPMTRSLSCKGPDAAPGVQMTLAGADPSVACPADGPEQFSVTDAGLLWAGPWGDGTQLEFSPHLADSCGPPDNGCFRGGMRLDSQESPS